MDLGGPSSVHKLPNIQREFAANDWLVTAYAGPALCRGCGKCFAGPDDARRAASVHNPGYEEFLSAKRTWITYIFARVHASEISCGPISSRRAAGIDLQLGLNVTLSSRANH
jgi:hypothetical protein